MMMSGGTDSQMRAQRGGRLPLEPPLICKALLVELYFRLRKQAVMLKERTEWENSQPAWTSSTMAATQAVTQQGITSFGNSGSDPLCQHVLATHPTVTATQSHLSFTFLS